MARIVIVGSGVVGTATGRGLASAGHQVLHVDVSPARVAALRAEGLEAGEEVVLDARGSFVFLTLPTPHAGHRYDLAAFDAGVASVGRALAGSGAVHTVVVRSTVPPGTTDGRVRDTLERESRKRCGEGFRLASNPEFLRAATAADDFARPWMTVVASRDPVAREALAALLRPFGGELRVFDDPRSAELVKCAHNAYNATKISFWNEVWLLAREAGVDADAVAATVARSAEGSFNPLYGIRGGAPFAGACLPKDTHGLVGWADDLGVGAPLLRAVLEVNERVGQLGREPLPARAPAASVVLDLTQDEVPAAAR